MNNTLLEKEQTKEHIVLPLGQRLLQCGFREITDLDVELDCKSIAEMEVQLEISNLIEKRKKAGDTRLRSSIRKDTLPRKTLKAGYRFNNDPTEEVEYIEGEVRGGSNGNSIYETNRIVCYPRVVELDNYITDIIPDSIHEKINIAKELGVENFYVAFPVIYAEKHPEPREDPIVFTMLGTEMLFIGKW